MPRAPRSKKPAAAAEASAPYTTNPTHPANPGPSSPPKTVVASPQPPVEKPIAISSLLNHPDTEPTEAGSSSQSAAAFKPATKGRPKNDHLPWLTQELPALPGPDGEMYIPIYDDCNEIRRKIRAFFSNNNTEYRCTQKYFLEVIGNVNSNSYRRFMAAKGEGGGAENGTYTGSYVFFEKKRVWEGKPKGKKRLDAEVQYPEGRDLVDSNRPVWVTTRMF
ncbi:hypothetical protein DFH27DRAFT_73510 [Peziza echinospora]|nr:hypothetical protein DFH27DRAFT_73510 [Peziza echinospora]